MPLVFINVLRYGKSIIIYNTGLAMIASHILIHQESSISPVATLYMSLIVVLTGILTVAVSNNIQWLFVKVQNREKLKRFLGKEIVDGID